MQKKFLLRINQVLWDELSTWAQEELRSVNGQIEYLLREAVRQRRRKEIPPGDPDGSAETGDSIPGD
jgi:hypothetical protein